MNLHLRCADDWVADGYRWINCGTDKLPRNRPCPVITKRKFKAYSEDGGSLLFKRIAYSTVASPKHILVHYIGDESVACFAPHANSKRADARPFETKRSICTYSCRHEGMLNALVKTVIMNTL